MMTGQKFTIAAIQLNTGNEMAANIKRATTLIQQAATRGAEFITLPENTFFMGANLAENFANSDAMDKHKAVLAMQELAAKLSVWLLFCVSVKTGGDKRSNRSVLVDAQGEITACYDKIHLFDADIPNGESHRESDNFNPGEVAVTADLPWTKLGMTICYDLRFPQLFRALAKDGAGIISVPSAFTYKTGEAHWHVLLRARAIENACYIIAPAQCGLHASGRRTYGHSLIIDPWGRILAEAGEGEEGVIIAEVDPGYAGQVRQALPSLQHDRNFVLK